MSGRMPHLLTVTDVSAPTPHLRRIALSGPSLAKFPEGFLGGYVKALFHKASPSEPLRSIPESGKIELAAFYKRSYTIRAFDPIARTLTLDFVCMDAKGPATKWASRAEIGEKIVIAGPGPIKALDPSSDWVFLCGDMTALPAICVNLEAMPKSMRGYAVIHVLSEADKLELTAPEGIEVQWVVDGASCSDGLADAARGKPWLAGQVGVWSATEFSMMKSLRYYFRNERQVAPSNMYISSYWKQGDTDEGHKVAKRADSESGLP